jgi:hypothetical protein
MKPSLEVAQDLYISPILSSLCVAGTSLPMISDGRAESGAKSDEGAMNVGFL